MRLLPTSDQITDDLNDLKLRIAKMNARRNAHINLLQRKVMGGSLRSKYNPWSREYYRRLYNTYPHLYPYSTYPWRSSSLDSLELDKYYDSLNLDDKLYTYDLDDPLYKRIATRNPPASDLLSKLKDFVFEQERQMTTDLLRKISEDRKRSTDRNLYSRESKSLSRYETPLKNEPPFLNPINKKDNFYKRYNALIKKILRPLRKTSPIKYDPPKTPQTPKTTSLSPIKSNYLSKSYLDYYPSQFYNPYWYRYSSYPYYRRYLYDYDYLPKVQPASVPLDVESIIRKSNIDDYKPLKNTYPTYKYDPFESDSYLRSSLPTWKQYYYTQKLRSKPSNECFLDYYDPYYDFFPDTASVDSTDDLLSNEAAPQSDDPNHIVDEYRDAIYEDIIQNLRQKQLRRKTPLRADCKLFGYRVQDRPSYFTQPYPPHRPTYTYRAADSQKFPTYYPKDDTPNRPIFCKPTSDDHQNDNKEAADKERLAQEDYKIKLDDSKISPTDTQTRQNVVSPSAFHTKCTTPVDNSFHKYSATLSPSKTKTWNDGKSSPRNADDASPNKKLERYRSSNTLNKMKSPYDENKQKYDAEQKRISEYKPNSLSIDEYKADSGQYPDTSTSQCKPDTSVGQYKPDTSIGQYRPDDSTQYKPDTSIGQYRPDTSNQYKPDTYIGQYRPDISIGENRPDTFSQYKPDTSIGQYRPDISIGQNRPDTFSQYKPDTSIGQYRPDTSMGQNRPDTSSQYKPDTSIGQYRPDISTDLNRPDTSTGPYRPDTGFQYKDYNMGQFKSDIGQYKPDTVSQYKGETSTNEYKPDTSPTRFGFMKQENPNEYESVQPSDKFTPINSPTKAKPLGELRRPNYTSAEISADTFTPISSPTKSRPQLRRPSNYPESEFTKTSNPVDQFQRKHSFTDKRRESLTNETAPESRLQRLSSGSFGAGNRELADKYSDPAQRQSSPKARQQKPREAAGWQENLDRRESSDAAAELRRSSRSKQPTATERSLSRRNSMVFDPNKSGSQSTSRRNSIKPLQRRNSIQPATEKRSILQKMNHETKYDSEEPVSNEAESGSIEEQAEVPFKSLTQFQKKLSKDEMLGVDEVARKNVDRPAYQYDLNAEEPTGLLKTSLAETSYLDENPSSYEENSKDSLGRDTYNAKEQQFYPEYNNENRKYESIPQEQTYQTDTTSLDSNQKVQGESESNEYSGFYNQLASNVLEYSQDQPRSGHFDSYGDQEPSLVSQSSNDSRSRRSFQQDENADTSLSIHESPVRSHEPKEEQSLNSINEETEKVDDKPKESDGTTVGQTSAESTALTKPKRSVDYGKSPIPRELSRKSSRSALLSQSSDDKKLKNQSSAGELQKRMSKPKIGESKLRRTTSTFKVRPTGPVKKT